jgi:hypothetical protein
MNLTSSVGLGRYTKQISQMVKLPPFYYSVIVGLILSDGWLVFAYITNKNARLGFKQSLVNFGYFWFVFNLLSHYWSSYPHLVSGLREGTKTYGIEIFTRGLPCFTNFYNLFYVNKVKVIPNEIYNLLDPIALAHWIQEDGKIDRSGLILCIDSYTLQEVIILINVLIIRYELICSIHRSRPGQYRIYISKKSMVNLSSIILPYMHSSMLYKIHL